MGTNSNPSSSSDSADSFVYKRVLLKISGESLMGNLSYGIDPEMVARVAGEVKSVTDQGVQVSLVIGGGNIFRGISGAAAGMERATGDYMGMLATVMNALAMQNALENIGVYTRVLSALPISAICEPYIRRRAQRHMEKGACRDLCCRDRQSVLYHRYGSGPAGNEEMNCDAILKGTRVDGVYSADPEKHPDAERYDALTFMDVLSRDLAVMDASAISLARENNIPILVFSIEKSGGFEQVLRHQGKFTLINNKTS